MLNRRTQENLQRIKQMLLEVFGSNCTFGKLREIDSPFPEFELVVYLYNALEVGIAYDRSTYDIGIKQGDEYVILGDFTPKEIERGFKAMEPEVMKNNFLILDEVVRQMLSNQ